MSLKCGFDKAVKNWMWLVWLGLEFRMELNGRKPGVIGKFNRFHERATGTVSAERHAALFKPLPILGVELVPMSMTLRNLGAAVNSRQERPVGQDAWLSPQPHGRPFLFHGPLFFQKANDRVGGGRIEFCTVGVFQAENMSSVFNDGDLHPKTNTEVRNLLLSSVANGLDFPFNAAVPKSAGD